MRDNHEIFLKMIISILIIIIFLAAALKQEIQDKLWYHSIEMIRYQEILNNIYDRFINKT